MSKTKKNRLFRNAVFSLLFGCGNLPEMTDPNLSSARVGDLEECNTTEIGRPCLATRQSTCIAFPEGTWLRSALCTRRCNVDEDCSVYTNAHCDPYSFVCVKTCTSLEARDEIRCGTYSACIGSRGTPACLPYYFSGSPPRTQ